MYASGVCSAKRKPGGKMRKKAAKGAPTTNGRHNFERKDAANMGGA